MHRVAKAVASALVASAMLVGVTAGTASAKQPPAGRFQVVPPYSNQCVKVGGIYQANVDSAGQPVLLACDLLTGSFSAAQVERLTNACLAAGEDLGASVVFPSNDRG